MAQLTTTRGRRVAAVTDTRRATRRSDRPTPAPARLEGRKLARRGGRYSSQRDRVKEQEEIEGEIEDEEEEEKEKEEEEEEEEEEKEGKEEGETVTLRAGGGAEMELERRVERERERSLSPHPNSSSFSRAETGFNHHHQQKLRQEDEIESSSPPRPSLGSAYDPNLLPDETATTFISGVFSTPEPDNSITQTDIEGLDADLILEMLPHLDAHARKILDLLILKAPPRDLRRLLRVPGTVVSKRLRTYEQNFAAAKAPLGRSEYVAVREVEAALGGEEAFRPILYLVNLAMLANVAYTSNGEGESAFEKVKHIEHLFPTQFGDTVRTENFEVALDLRTYHLVLALIGRQDTKGFDPDVWLQVAFFEDERLKPWAGINDNDVHNWQGRVMQRIDEIRGCFAQNGDEEVDITGLTDMYTWENLVRKITGYIKLRFAEIEVARGGRTVEQLLEDMRNPQILEGARVRDILDDREIPETVQEEPTPIKPRSQGLQQLEAPARGGEESIAHSELSRLRKLVEQGHPKTKFDLTQHLTMAQIKDLKRRKTMPAPETIPAVRSTPRVATSLGSKNPAATFAQVKFLKSLANKNAENAKPSAEPARQPEAAPKQVEKEPGMAPAPPQPQEPAQAEEAAPEPVEEEDEEDISPEERAAMAELWKARIKATGMIRNKENDKSLAATIPPPPQPGRPLKRKRFIDPQEGATRISQIEDGTHELPAKRQQANKGKEREVIVEEQEHDEDEDAEMYQVDSRKENEERVKKSRKGLPESTSTAASAAPRTSTSSKPAENGANSKKIVMRGARESKGSRASGGNDAGNKNPATEVLVSDVNEHDVDDAEYREASQDEEEAEGTESEEERSQGEEDEELEESEETGEDSVDNDKRRAELNRKVQKIVEKQVAKRPKLEAVLRTRQAWGQKQTALLVKVIGEVGCKWAVIRDMNIPEFSGRSNVQLKDKARNIKYDYLRAKKKLPPNFEDVTISRSQVQTLLNAGIDPNDYTPNARE